MENATAIDFSKMYPYNVWAEAAGGVNCERLDAAELSACIDELNDLERQVIKGLFLEGHSYNEIASISGITASKVNAYRAKAFRKLRGMARRFLLVSSSEYYALKEVADGYEKALDALEKACAFEGLRWKMFPIKNISFTPFTYNRLVRCGYQTLGDVIENYTALATGQSPYRLPSKALKEVSEILKEYGFLPKEFE